jgi:uncharacterized protein
MHDPAALTTGLARSNWLGPPLRSLDGQAFDEACADLMRRVEADYAPTLVIGIRTGGLVVAECMVRFASTPLTVLPLTCRRASTQAKSRIPLLRSILLGLPRPARDLLRRMEHQYITAPRAHRPRRQDIDPGEVGAVVAHIASLVSPPRVLVADDAVDSGVTLAAVLALLRDIAPAGSEIRSAAITQTLEHPLARPDFVLFRSVLCRFPWSFDAAG